MGQDEKQLCPICQEQVDIFTRYPRYVCKNCLTRHPPVNAAGQEMEYFNLDLGGGFGSRIKTDPEDTPPGNDHICFVNGVKCWADEFRFGGIIIQVMVDEEETEEVTQ